MLVRADTFSVNIKWFALLLSNVCDDESFFEFAVLRFVLKHFEQLENK